MKLGGELAVFRMGMENGRWGKGCLGTDGLGKGCLGNRFWLVGLQLTPVGGWLWMGEEGFEKGWWERVFK